MTVNRGASRKGSSILEFVLVGIPIMFILISLFEITRAMWVYQTAAYAVREGARFASVHGKGCASPHTCQVNIGQIAAVIRDAGPGLNVNTTMLTFTTATGTSTTNTLTSLLTNTTTWPPSTANAPGLNVKITVRSPVRTFIAMLWPGAGGFFGRSQVINLSASSTQPIRF